MLDYIYLWRDIKWVDIKDDDVLFRINADLDVHVEGNKDDIFLTKIANMNLINTMIFLLTI